MHRTADRFHYSLEGDHRGGDPHGTDADASHRAACVAPHAQDEIQRQRMTPHLFDMRILTKDAVSGNLVLQNNVGGILRVDGRRAIFIGDSQRVIPPEQVAVGPPLTL